MRRRALALLLLALALAGATTAVGRRLDVRGKAPYYDLDFVPRASALRWLAVGHPTLLADFYWLQAVQYMGEPRADVRGWDKLFPILDLVTDLDPRHGYAYQVGGNVLAGLGRLDESNRLLEKGTRNLPERYILPFHRAVNAFLYEGDYAKAGRWFERAAAVPNAPPHLREYVFAMYVKGNKAEAAIGFLSHLLDSLSDPESRKGVEKQLQQARLERAALQIDAAVERYKERFHEPPAKVSQLHAAGLLAEIPPDPFGGYWILDDEGRAHSSLNDRRMQRPMSEAERRLSVGRLGTQMKGMSSQ